MEGFRRDIEGLRALAVGSVLLYHAHLLGFRGGYIGVDVFFVLSGFLITRLLAGEVDRSGTVSLRGFWARRVRRLLPASTLVLLATVVAARFIVDPLTRGFITRSALAAAGFAANLLFWSRGGYSHVDLPEPLLHFWSLAVEEQFYVFWPLLLLCAARLTSNFRRSVAVLSVALGAVSLWLCIWQTPKRESFTFYWLPTRAWELLAGALLAVAPAALLRRAPFFRAVLGWSGLAVLALGWFTYGDPAQSFPGYRALLPVLATCAVIVGGVNAPEGPERLLALPPLQWVGRHSYAIYLWHFPLLVLAEAGWGPLPWGTRAALLASSLVLAAISLVVIEQPARSSKRLAARPGLSLALGAVLVAVSIGVSLVVDTRNRGGWTEISAAPPTLATVASTPLQPVSTTDLAAVESTAAHAADTTLPSERTTSSVSPSTAVRPTSTEAPRSTTNHPSVVALAQANRALIDQAIANELLPSNLEPPLERAFDEKPVVYTDGCMLSDGQTTPKSCEYGDVSSSTTIVLFGDSHAAQWFPAFEATAIKHHWKLVLVGKKHCPFAEVAQAEERYTRECYGWRRKAIARIAEIRPEIVVLAQYWYVGPTWSTYRLGVERTITSLQESSGRVVMMGDVPRQRYMIPTCVAAHPEKVSACMADRATAINAQRADVDAVAVRNRKADRVLPDDWLCGEVRCPVLIGNILLYRDDNHLSPAGAALLTPYIEAMLLVYLPSGEKAGD